MFRSILRISILCALGVAVVGCGGDGPELARVKGKVTYNGQPVAGATVTFMPTTGPLATGVTDSSGEFTLTTTGKPGAVLGKHRVGITKMAAAGEGGAAGMTPDDMKKMQMEQMKGGGDETVKSEIPEKYADPKSSGLEATVSSNASENEFEYTLTD